MQRDLNKHNEAPTDQPTLGTTKPAVYKGTEATEWNTLAAGLKLQGKQLFDHPTDLDQRGHKRYSGSISCSASSSLQSTP